MPRYLLSIIQRDGAPPAPEIFEPIMRDVAAFSAELRASGAWRFNSGCVLLGELHNSHYRK